MLLRNLRSSRDRALLLLKSRVERDAASHASITSAAIPEIIRRERPIRNKPTKMVRSGEMDSSLAEGVD